MLSGSCPLNAEVIFRQFINAEVVPERRNDKHVNKSLAVISALICVDRV